jgi:hypothetical protein
MPCFDPQSAEEDRQAREFQRQFGPLMCEAVRLLRVAGLLEKSSSALQKWAREHAAEDAKRGL